LIPKHPTCVIDPPIDPLSGRPLKAGTIFAALSNLRLASVYENRHERRSGQRVWREGQGTINESVEKITDDPVQEAKGDAEQVVGEARKELADAKEDLKDAADDAVVRTDDTPPAAP
jgi:uncharacterized protein YjbJ (UPF0337 family)